MSDLARAWEWSQLPMLRDHQPTEDDASTCAACGQPWPCDAFRLASALAGILSSWHETPDEARACGSERCTAALAALTTAVRG